MNTDLEPLAVYDVHAPEFRALWGTDWHMELIAWAEGENLPVNNIKRLEIHLLDALFARVVEYALNADGQKYLSCTAGHHSCDAALRDPYEVPLTSLPPELAAREALGAAERRPAPPEGGGPGAGPAGPHAPPKPPAAPSGPPP